VAIAGGDTNIFDGPLVLSVTAIGQATKGGPLLRSGGQVGDWLLVTGQLGGSILGHMFDFTPRVVEALALRVAFQEHAGIDISDGLALDASRLATESGCGAVIYTDSVPISSDAYRLADQENAADRDAAALQHALSDGQDFELLVAAPPDEAKRILQSQQAGCPITHVGELVAECGLWQQDDSSRRPIKPTGWVHR
jgi:thiamine-monophosphate kinase